MWGIVIGGLFAQCNGYDLYSFSQEQFFSVVSDVAKYREFIPYCKGKQRVPLWALVVHVGTSGYIC